jgi:hypothetical protein
MEISACQRRPNIRQIFLRVCFSPGRSAESKANVFHQRQSHGLKLGMKGNVGRNANCVRHTIYQRMKIQVWQERKEKQMVKRSMLPKKQK